MNRKPWLVVVLGCAAAFAVTALAQEPKEEQKPKPASAAQPQMPDPAAMQEAFKMMMPGEHHRLLEH